jgi:18S rRNA (guanine1575-N7)-methyltransferase
MSRPEDTLYASQSIQNPVAKVLTIYTSSPPDLFYNDIESRKYTTSSRIRSIQSSMTHRALSLLDLTSPSLILDVGCGSGLSGEILSEPDPETPGGPHIWIGFDISASMLGVALEKDVEGDLLLADAGQGVPFRPGTFDAAISISAVQWLCQAESSAEWDTPGARLSRFFNGLYASLRRGGRAVCQFYPKNDEQKKMVSQAAIKAGFGAGLLEDDMGTKNAKTYLVLTVGGGELDGDITGVVRGMDGVDVMDARRRQKGMKRGEEKKGSKAWIIKKKDQMEKQGKVVKATSKYTGRKRRIQF